MGAVLDEFDFLVEEEQEDNSTFEDDSNNYIALARQFIDSIDKFPDRTYQGIPIKAYADAICIGESDIVPWEHVGFTIDVNKLKDLSNHKLEEFIIPSFIEELESIGDKAGTEFGFNQSGRNILKYIEIPSSVIVIAPNTFAFYKKLENIKFKENSKLIYLGSQAFVGCESLHTLDLRKCHDLDELKEGTFDGSGIQTLKISSDIRKMCSLSNTNIKTVYVDDEAYPIKEFNQLMRNSVSDVFWISTSYDF